MITAPMNDHAVIDNFEIRPHHLLCMKQFGGKGYSVPFTENMKRIRSAVQAGNHFRRLRMEKKRHMQLETVTDQAVAVLCSLHRG
ncbi:MAG: hypothetical protein LKF96_08745 [Treponema sp.]|nr:hypothetical protein [Treponema sp.]